MCYKASSTAFAALTATLLISSAPIAHAATLQTGTVGTFVPVPGDFTVTGTSVTADPLSTFTDVSFTVNASRSLFSSASVTVTATGSNGGPLTAPTLSMPIFGASSVSQAYTFTDPTPLTSLAISFATTGSPTISPVNFTGVSGLQVVPLPATLPLFASGLGALGLLGWRRKRKSTTSILAA